METGHGRQPPPRPEASDPADARRHRGRQARQGRCHHLARSARHLRENQGPRHIGALVHDASRRDAGPPSAGLESVCWSEGGIDRRSARAISPAAICAASPWRSIKRPKPILSRSLVFGFSLLTGARRGEALALEWPMIEGDRAILPDSKTGPKCLWLATPVRRLLAALVRIEGSQLVFARPCGRGLGSSLERVWHGVREGAGLDGLRLHDLRHNYASVAVNIGEELRTVAGLLGHSQMTTTRGYAHLADRRVMAAAWRVDEHLAASLEPPETVEPIRPKSWDPKKKKKRPEPPSLDAGLSARPSEASHVEDRTKRGGAALGSPSSSLAED